MSEEYTPDNLLDRNTSQATMEVHYEQVRRREAALLAPLVAAGGDVLSVGCGWNPGRHIFPQPAWRMTGVELESLKPDALVADGTLEHGFAGRAGQLGLPDDSFDAVLYRLVLHHIAYQGSLAPVFDEAAALLRPGGVFVAVEPGLWHPIGAALTVANAVGAGTAVHGTPDDIPLSAPDLAGAARSAGFTDIQVFGVTYTWRRLPPAVQRALWPVDAALGSRPRGARLGHTLMLTARQSR